MYYDLIDYFDVWGNEDDGWDVNDLCKVEENIYISDDATDEDILKYLNSIEFFSNATTENVEVEWLDEYIIEFTQKSNGLPLGRLERRM